MRRSSFVPVPDWGILVELFVLWPYKKNEGEGDYHENGHSCDG